MSDAMRSAMVESALEQLTSRKEVYDANVSPDLAKSLLWKIIQSKDIRSKAQTTLDAHIHIGLSGPANKMVDEYMETALRG